MPILIQGLKQSGNDIDVYLEPLVDDLLKMWEEGVAFWDEYETNISWPRKHFLLQSSTYQGKVACLAKR
jgi:hypothetical protein